MAYMYTGNILVVDLSTGSVEEPFLEDSLIEDRTGGALVAMELLREHADGDPVVLASGPLTGALVPVASNTTLSCRSPLTGGVVHASLTNHAGVEFKYAGYDFIVVKGASPDPVYLWVHDEQAELLEADDLAGADAFAVTDAVRHRQGDDRVQVLVAGPACAAGSLAAGLTLNYWASTDRAAAGALLGRKRLLAIAARGMGELEPYDIDAIGPAALRLLEGFRSRQEPEGFGWDGGTLDDARRAIAPLVHRKRGCFFCLSGGRPFLMLDDDPSRMEESTVEHPGVFLSDLLPVGDLVAAGLDGRGAAEVTRRCHRLSLDPARAARAVRASGASEVGAATRVLEDLARGEGAPPAGTPMVPWELGDGTGAHQAFCALGAFTPANPPLAPAGGVDGAESLVVRQALAYVLGLCPAGILEAGFTATDLADVVEAATGLGLDAEGLEAQARRLVAETLRTQPAAARPASGPGAELWGRFEG